MVTTMQSVGSVTTLPEKQIHCSIETLVATGKKDPLLEILVNNRPYTSPTQLILIEYLHQMAKTDKDTPDSDPNGWIFSKILFF